MRLCVLSIALMLSGSALASPSLLGGKTLTLSVLAQDDEGAPSGATVLRDDGPQLGTALGFLYTGDAFTGVGALFAIAGLAGAGPVIAVLGLVQVAIGVTCFILTYRVVKQREEWNAAHGISRADEPNHAMPVYAMNF